MRVLVVDDSETNRVLLREMLGDKAVEIDEAEDGLIAWRLYTKSLDTQRYDVCLLDIAMPKMDGIKLLKLIRENENFVYEVKLPVLVISAHKDKIEAARAAGFDDYMLKPVSVDGLYEKISKVTKREL